jgi:O-antigen/teichoic acid export membrane protein
MSQILPPFVRPLNLPASIETVANETKPAGGWVANRLRQFGFTANSGGLRARFQKGITWNIAGAVLNNGSNFLTNILIANLLGREVFGQYGMIQSTLTTFVGVAQAAGGITATKYVAEFRSHDKEKAGRVLGLCAATTIATGCISTLLIFLCAPWLAHNTLKAAALQRPLQIAAAVVFFTVVNAFQTGALAGLESYKQWAIANGLQGPFQFGICVFSTWRWGLQGAVAGLLVSSAVRWLILHIAMKWEANKQGITLRFSGFWQERAIFMKFALPAALSGLSAAPAIWLGNTFLVRQAGGYSQMALFSAALNLKNVVIFLPILLNNQRGQKDRLSYRKVFWTNMVLTGSAALLGAVIIGAFGPHLLRLYGKTFPEGQGILTLLLCAAILEVLAMASYQIIQSEEKMWLSLLGVMLPRDLALVFLAYRLTPLYGAVGLGLAHLIAWILCSTVIFSVVFHIGLKPHAVTPLLHPVQLSGLVEGDPEL